MARSHQSLVCDRTRHVLRLRSVLREFFPAALDAFADLDAADALELPRLAPDPDLAARLSIARIRSALRAPAAPDRGEGFRDPGRAASPGAAAARPGAGRARGDHRQPGPPDRHAEHRDCGLGEVVAAHFGRHRDAEIYASQPGLGVILDTRVLGEFGDDSHGAQRRRDQFAEDPRAGRGTTGGDLGRDRARAQRPGKEAPGGRKVTPPGQQDVDDLAMLVDRPVQDRSVCRRPSRTSHRRTTGHQERDGIAWPPR